MNKGKKALAVLSTAALFGTTPAAVALPFMTATVAHAAGTATALVVPNISNSQDYADLGTIDIFFPKGALASGADNQFTLLLPTGFQFDQTFTPNVTYDLGNDGAGTTPETVKVNTAVASNTLLKVWIGKSADGSYYVQHDGTTRLTQSDDWHFYVHLDHVKVQGPGNGPVNVTLMGPSNSAFPTGTVTVANVATAGKVDLAATDVKSSSNDFTFNLVVSEEVAKSLRPGSNTLKLKLPSGFKWYKASQTSDVTTGGTVTVSDVFGDPHGTTGVKVSNDGDQSLWITVHNKSSKASGYLINNLSFYVDDENVARTGDVTVQVTGASSTNVSSLVVGHYGQIGFTATAESKPTIIAGQKEQIIGDIIIKETVPGSFVHDRTVTLTLPDQARWESQFENPNATDIQGAYSTTNGISIGKIQYTGTDKRTLKLTISGDSSLNSTNPAKIDLRNLQVATQPGYTGDLTIQLGGTEGVTGNVTVATVQSPVSIKVDNAPNVIIGSGGQSIGTITLTENVAGGFAKTTVKTKTTSKEETYNEETYNQVHLQLPTGVEFDGTPDVQVTQGDLSIKDVSTGRESNGSGKGYLDFYVDTESTTPSVITIKNAKLKVDRTVPEGDLVLKVKGNSVAFTANYTINGSAAVQPWADNFGTAASTVVAHVVTAAQAGSIQASFTVGSTTYTVNGQQQTMDVAPYLKNDGRVMLPVRYVANALGVNDNSIIWNQDDKSVTIFKDGNVVKLTIGSNTMIVNGTAVTMDVAPELYNDGRTMLPLRWVAQALNADITWDQNTQTATVTTKPLTTYQQ